MRKLIKGMLILGIIVYGFFFLGDFGLKERLPFFKTDPYASQYIYVLERESQEVIYEKKAHSKAYPASLTKIMTTLVALEKLEDISSEATVDTETYRSMIQENASMAGFFGGEAVTYRDLLYGTILSSGGEAANSLAINIAGSREAFVELMNEKAKELGMKKTKFTNVEGLHDKKQYTSASDMAKLLDYALDNGDFRAIFTKESFQTLATNEHPNGITLKSTVLSELSPDMQDGFEIIGGKSGTTEEAGQCWATLGHVNDKAYITIVMGAPLNDISAPDHIQRDDTLELFKLIKASK